MAKVKDKIVKLFIDDREDERRQKRVMEYNQEYAPQIKHLKYGDYHYITKKGKRVVWEFKTGSDFLSSIQDNHLHNQVYNMKRHYDYTFVVIQCSDWEYMLQSYKRMTGIDMSLKRVAGVIAYLNCHTTVIQTKTLSNAMYMMKRQSEKIIEDKPLSYKFNRKSENYAENRLNCIHGVSEEIARNIVTTLNLKSERDLMNLTIKDLQSCDGIGIKKSENILRQLQGAG